MTIELSARLYLRAFMIFVAGLTATSFLTQMAWRIGLYDRRGLFKTLDVNREGSLPTWYASLALALAAVLLALIVRELTARKETRDLPRWSALAVGFLFLSVDEIAGFHEQFGQALHAVGRFEGWLRYPWVIAAVGAMFVLIPYFFDFLLRMAPRMRRQFIVAGLMYVGGAVILEMAGGKILDQCVNEDCLSYRVIVHAEEFLEMTGVVLFNAALIEYLARLRGDAALCLRFVKD